ncbi:MAG: serine hydrolase domain-containing protein, partial [Terriglobales bacterium]
AMALAVVRRRNPVQTPHRFRADTERGIDRCTFLKSAVTGATLALAPAALWNGLNLAQASPENLEGVLEPIRRTHDVPALAGAFVRGRELVALGAVGVRQARGMERVQSIDRFHIGSNTKSMTATLIAMLVEQGRMSWEMTIADAFPDLVSRIHRGFHRATLVQLLSHRSGLPGDPANPEIWRQVWDLAGPPLQQRRSLVELVLAQPPVAQPGARMAYSNYNYAIAGAMAEQATGQAWEDMMRQMLFGPLGMTIAGFGSPGLAQPWGHTPAGCQPVTPGPQADNPPVIGPAGAVHCSMSDWAAYASLHLRGAQGESGLLLKQESFQQLHGDGFRQEYAMGWAVVQRPWAGGMALFHGGSNTMWFAVIWIAPARNAAMMAATNCGSQDGFQACDAAVGAMFGRFVP